MDATTHKPQNDKVTREACRLVIMRYLNGCTHAVDIRQIAPIYHGHYAMRTGTPRWGNISQFLKRMEDDGLVHCTYTRDGFVSSVIPKERGTTVFESLDADHS